MRYRSLYNLGWVEVTRADGQLKDDPAQALQHLQQAVNRFREAVRVRPDSNEARHNLEIVSQRLLELTDALAKKDPRDMASRLDEVIRQLRGHQAELQAVVQQTGEEVQKTLVDTYRPEFRRLGITQRQIIADYQRVADDARNNSMPSIRSPRTNSHRRNSSTPANTPACCGFWTAACNDSIRVAA